MIEKIRDVIKQHDCEKLNLCTLIEKQQKYVISLKQKYINIETDIKLEQEKYCYIYKNECVLINSDKLQELHLNNSPKYIYYLNESTDSYYSNFGLIKYPTSTDLESMDFTTIVKIVFQFVAQNRIKSYSEYLEILKKMDINSVKIDILREFSTYEKLINILIFMLGENDISNYMLYFNYEKIHESILYLFDKQRKEEKETKNFTILTKKSEVNKNQKRKRENKVKKKLKNESNADVNKQKSDDNKTLQNAIDNIIRREFQIENEDEKSQINKNNNDDDDYKKEDDDIDYDDDWYDL